MALPKRGQLAVVVGQKVSDHNSHGALAEKLAGWIVINRGDRHHVALTEAVPAAIAKTNDRHGDDATSRVEFSVKLGDVLSAGGIHEAQLPAVIVEVATDSDQHTRVTETELSRGHILARRQVVARATAVPHVEPRRVDALQLGAACDQRL